MVRAPVVSGSSKWLNRHIFQDMCPWKLRFASDLQEPAFAAREALAGRDARTLAREHAAWALGRLAAGPGPSTPDARQASTATASVPPSREGRAAARPSSLDS